MGLSMSWRVALAASGASMTSRCAWSERELRDHCPGQKPRGVLKREDETVQSRVTVANAGRQLVLVVE